jgi:hypothetical protein
MQRAVLEVWPALTREPDVVFLNHRVFQRLHEPALADAGIAGDDGETAATLLRLVPQSSKLGPLRVTADERRELRRVGVLEVTGALELAEDLIHSRRALLATVGGRERLRLEEVPRQLERRLARDDRAARRGFRQLAGEIWHVAGHRGNGLSRRRPARQRDEPAVNGDREIGRGSALLCVLTHRLRNL